MPRPAPEGTPAPGLPATGGGVATAERLLAVAAELFARDGYRGTGLRRVAAAAGVAVGTVYAHFPDKQALLDALLARAAQRLRRGLAWVWLTPGLPAAERWCRFRRALAGALPWLACEQEAREAGGERAGRIEQAAGTVGAVAREALARLLEEGARRGEVRLPLPDPRAAAEAVLGAAVGMWRAGHADAIDLIWYGLEVRNPGEAGPGGVRREVLGTKPGETRSTGVAPAHASRSMPDST